MIGNRLRDKLDQADPFGGGEKRLLAGMNADAQVSSALDRNTQQQSNATAGYDSAQKAFADSLTAGTAFQTQEQNEIAGLLQKMGLQLDFIQQYMASIGGNFGSNGFETQVSQKPGLLQQAAGLAATYAGAGGSFCWVAREVYGEDNPKWKEFRFWMFDESHPRFFYPYTKYGEHFADFIHNKPLLGRTVRRVFDWILDRRSWMSNFIQSILSAIRGTPSAADRVDVLRKAKTQPIAPIGLGVMAQPQGVLSSHGPIGDRSRYGDQPCRPGHRQGHQSREQDQTVRRVGRAVTRPDHRECRPLRNDHVDGPPWRSRSGSLWHRCDEGALELEPLEEDRDRIDLVVLLRHRLLPEAVPEPGQRIGGIDRLGQRRGPEGIAGHRILPVGPREPSPPCPTSRSRRSQTA